MSVSFRAVIEVLGKPKEHVEKTLGEYVATMKNGAKYGVLHEEFEDAREHDDGLYVSFAELEIRTERPIDILNFCFDYMPSVMEILEPEEITFSDVEMGTFLNDLQSRLHQIEMLAKQIKGERDIQAENTAAILRNFLLMILKNRNYDLNVLSGITGVAKKSLEGFVGLLVADGILSEKAGLYTANLINDKKNVDGIDGAGMHGHLEKSQDGGVTEKDNANSQKVKVSIVDAEAASPAGDGEAYGSKS